jgi:hypothetical protein
VLPVWRKHYLYSLTSTPYSVVPATVPVSPSSRRCHDSQFFLPARFDRTDRHRHRSSTTGPPLVHHWSTLRTHHFAPTPNTCTLTDIAIAPEGKSFTGPWKLRSRPRFRT